MDVSKCMQTKLVLSKPDCVFKTLLVKIIASAHEQIYVVDDQYQLLGLITTFDLLKQIVPSYMTSDLARSVTQGGDFMDKQVEKVKDKPAKEIMTTKFVALRPENQLALADAIIVETGWNALPVIDKQGKLLGEISRTDILKRYVDTHLSDMPITSQIVDLSKI